MKEHWTLDPAFAFLNHGSFGACPRAVLDEQARLRALLERQPVRFFTRELEPLLDDARAALAGFVGADPADLAFVPNATSGVNAVVRSLDLAPGDELLTTDHAYNACKNALDYVAARAGAAVVVAPLPFPLRSPDEIVEAISSRATARTRLALVDHVTSPTGLVLPVERIVPALERRGVAVLVDGAHAPGMVALDLAALGASFYTGNCHKWLCAPKGAAFLHVRRDRQPSVRPTAISHGANSPRPNEPGGRSRFLLEFDWTGTQDPTPYLCIPRAISLLASLVGGGWPALRAANRAKALAARDLLCRTLSIAPPAPDSMIGALAAIPLPDGDAPALQDTLFDLGIEVPIMPWPAPPHRLLRISAQLYNTDEDYARLATTLPKLLPSN